VIRGSRSQDWERAGGVLNLHFIKILGGDRKAYEYSSNGGISDTLGVSGETSGEYFTL
jgi:hypothetical protein